MHAPAITNEIVSDLSVRHGARAPSRSVGRTRPLVFLAEDDADLRRILCAALREAGFDVLSASTGREMLALLTAASRDELRVPDAIVMDIRMPRCSGLDVLSALRRADWREPVIMITGFGDPTLHEEAASHGASVVLDKPVDTEDLIDVLEVLLRLSPAKASSSVESQEDGDDPEPETVRSPPSELRVVESPIDVRCHLGPF